jgi:hypothetical protein
VSTFEILRQVIQAERVYLQARLEIERSTIIDIELSTENGQKVSLMLNTAIIGTMLHLHTI